MVAESGTIVLDADEVITTANLQVASVNETFTILTEPKQTLSGTFTEVPSDESGRFTITHGPRSEHWPLMELNLDVTGATPDITSTNVNQVDFRIQRTNVTGTPTEDDWDNVRQRNKDSLRFNGPYQLQWHADASNPIASGVAPYTYRVQGAAAFVEGSSVIVLNELRTTIKKREK